MLNKTNRGYAASYKLGIKSEELLSQRFLTKKAQTYLFNGGLRMENDFAVIPIFEWSEKNSPLSIFFFEKTYY